MRRIVFIVIALLALAGILLASGTNTETFNKVRYIFPAATELNTVEGYWGKTANVTAAYVNYYPTGCAYTFILNCDSANTVARSGSNYVPAIIDFPMWKHHGVIGSFAFNMVDTGGTGVQWVTSDDSLFVLVKLVGVPAPTTYDTAIDSIFMSPASNGVLIQTLLDSTDGNSPAKILKTTSSGVTWTSAYNGSVDLSDENLFFERMKVFAMQAGADNFNSKTCRIALRLWLPYSDSYRNSDYYLKNQAVK